MPGSIRDANSARAVVFAPLEGAGRAELVERRLTDGIVLGLLADGERLPSESDMARRFGVATVTAREALEALRGKGLVDTRRGRGGGSFVTAGGALRRSVIDERLRSLTRVETRDMGTYYAAIAGACAALAADRATSDDIDRLRGIAEGGADDEIAARRQQGFFHLELAALSQSPRLVREELRMQAEFAPLLWLGMREPEYRRDSRAARITVVDALAGADSDTARARTESDVTTAIEWLLDEKTRIDER